MSGSRATGLLLLVATAAGTLLPGLAAPVVVALGLAAWLALRPGRLWALLVAPPLVVAAVLLAVEWRQASRHERAVSRAEAAFGELLSDLDGSAADAAAVLSPPRGDRESRRRAFGELERLATSVGPRARARGDDARTWVLFDPDGEQVAWAGRGLVHEIDGPDVPRSGRVHVSSFTATTFMTVVPLGEERRPWRVGCGVTVQSDRLPGPASGGEVMWAVVEPGGEPGAGTTSLDVGGLELTLRGSPPPPRGRPSRALLGAALALALAAFLATARGPAPLRGWWLVPALGAASLAALALAVPAVVFVIAAAGLAALRFGAGERAVPLRAVPGVVAAGLVLAALLVAAAVLVQHRAGPIDLGAGFGGGGERVALRGAVFLLAAGLLRLLAGTGVRSAGIWVWICAAGLVAGAAASGWTVPGAAALAVAGIGAAGWSASGGWHRRAAGAAVGVIVAAMLGALAWEVAYREALERRLAAVVEEELGPPSVAEIEALAIDSGEFFAELALENLTPAAPEELEPQDLAFALWRRSPLARSGRLSSVVVGSPDDPVSVFDYGLTAAGGGAAAMAGRQAYLVPGWSEAEVEGEGLLTLGGGPWATVTYRVRLQPGFRSAQPVSESLAVGLLRRERSTGFAAELPGDARVGFFTAAGEVVLPPWRSAADLPVEPIPRRVEMPHGWAKTFPAAAAGGWGVAFLPISTPLAGAERVAVHAAGSLLAVAAVLLAWALVRHGGARGWSAVRAAWRSYSKRLVILYTALLMVPVLLVNVLVLRMFDRRLDSERQAAGYSALESGQRVLADYVGSLEPGFGIDTAVGDEVLLWLSRVVHHEVNLYWGSRLSASSKRELFSSGLLPPRIPGDVFARVALSGAEVASRRTRAGEAIYEEFYAPLVLGDEPRDEPALFISIPLLSQEVATASEMAVIRRRVLLSALALAALLAALGRRLGQSLTRPLLQVVEATRSIAAGAPSIQVATTDSELATLVEAVDNMARRIAAGREALLEEKQLVDQMIDNVNSGVVSVDRQGRVLIMNRMAHRLLGVEIGEVLRDAVAADERLAAVAEFVRVARDEARQRTVRLASEEGEESEWTLVWVPLPGSAGPAALFVIEDVTEVLRGQRLEAWAEMARMIAHEVKNPLTPIRLSTEHLRAVSRSRRGDLEQVLEQCTANILRQVDELQQIASEFSVYSRIPQIDLRPGDLAELVEEIVAGYRHGPVEVELEVAAADGPWQTDFDARLLGRAVRNLLENSLRATGDGGRVTVSLAAAGEHFELRVADTGAGVEPRHLARLFEPYFSTEASGTGLGLPITKRIVEEHGGHVAARHVAPHGLEIVITLPRRGAR